MRIGIDVGGTNTDAVLMDAERVVAWTKTPTTPQVSDGISTALRELVAQSKLRVESVDGVMFGTTHFTNAVLERKRLQRTATIRLGLPATACLPPMVDWPDALREVVGGHCFLAHGGHHFDGRELSRFDESEIREIAQKIRDQGITGIAISSVFSPVDGSLEQRAAAIVGEIIPEAKITLSSHIGRIGLLERENAAIMNSCLRALALETIHGFEAALAQLGITAPFFVTQNDGTLMSSDYAAAHPVLTFASGPTNSMRGAAFLSGLKEAIVIDVGGTTTDVGVLQRGFPRIAGLPTAIGGVRTNFRMPDMLSIALGGGSVIATEPFTIGPESVGHELTTKALVFGGDVMTATDIVVASGKAKIGDASRVARLERGLIANVEKRIAQTIDIAVESMKTSAKPMPLVIVGGGSILIQHEVAGTSDVVQPEHYAVANAVGAAIAQVGGACDRVFSLTELSRQQALDAAKQEAVERAVRAGAEPRSVEVVDVDEVPLAYLPGNAIRITVRAVGDLRQPNG